MKVRLAAEIQPDSIVDGKGVRTVIWFQGCTHNCEGCHNPTSHALDGGFEVELEDILAVMENLENQEGITLSGGEPMLQPSAALAIVKQAKRLNMNVWSWSGFTFEEILELAKSQPIYLELLNNIDVLVDGKFEIDKFSLNIKFRGSSNQRIIDVKKSLESKIGVSV